MKRLAALLLALGPAAHAAGVASLLDEPVGARAMSMGGAGAATADGAVALQWNPARLGTLKDGGQEAAASHAEISRDTKLEWLGYAVQADDAWGGVTALYRDRPGSPAGDLETSDVALTAGFAKRDDNGLGGVSMRYLRSRVPGAQAHSFAADLGISRGEDGSTTAFVIRNAGPGLRYGSIKKDLPLTVALGLARDLKSLTLAGDYEYRPFTGAHDFGGGAEWEFASGLFARGGWTTKDGKAPELVLSRGFSFGGGMKWGGLRLDYGFRPKAGRSHRFDLGWRF